MNAFAAALEKTILKRLAENGLYSQSELISPIIISFYLFDAITSIKSMEIMECMYEKVSR